MLGLIFLIAALLCFVAAAVPSFAPHHGRLIAIGLACLTASMVSPRFVP